MATGLETLQHLQPSLPASHSMGWWGAGPGCCAARGRRRGLCPERRSSLTPRTGKYHLHWEQHLPITHSPPHCWPESSTDWLVVGRSRRPGTWGSSCFLGLRGWWLTWREDLWRDRVWRLRVWRSLSLLVSPPSPGVKNEQSSQLSTCRLRKSLQKSRKVRLSRSLFC